MKIRKIAAACLALLPAAMLAANPPLAGDAHVSKGAAALNFGALGTVNVGGTVSPAPNMGLFQFQLAASLPAGTTAAQIAKATFSLFVNKVNAPGPVDIHAAAAAWDETSVTFANAPGLSTPVAASVPVAVSGVWITVDATAIVKDWVSGALPNNGFIVVPSASNPATSVLFDSKEATTTSHAAVLDVTIAASGGAAGPAGPAGPQGPTGPAGAIGPIGPTGALTLPFTGSVAVLPPALQITNHTGPGIVGASKGYQMEGVRGSGGTYGAGLLATGGDGQLATRRAGHGIRAKGGAGPAGGDGALIEGGASDSVPGAGGVRAYGGQASGRFSGGPGIAGVGGGALGSGIGGSGGDFHGGSPNGVGIAATGGAASPSGGTGGMAGFFQGGTSVPGTAAYSGSYGVIARGGDATAGGTGAAGGIGIFAAGGSATGPAAGGPGILATGGLAGAPGGPTLAARFNGNVEVTGHVSKGAGSFKIDHPLDPLNKYLYHSFVESPDMKNIYDGVVRLDADGRATVTLPDWFEALNGGFRYQLTSIGAPGPGLFIAREISGNSFEIAGGPSGGKVSWQVTGTRHDAFAERGRIPVEQDKPEGEKGLYLHPEAFGKPPEESAALAAYPEIRKSLAEQRARIAK